jgi:uncharacterized repeat protein (TIGR04076 family)
MNIVKIKVLKRSLNKELAQALGGREIGACEVFEEGQEFFTAFTKPEGFCDWAWNDISKVAISLLTGGDFSKGLFNGWLKREGAMVACCTDGFRPVSFLLERFDTEELTDVEGIKDPAPKAVYGSERWGEFSYALDGLKPGSAYSLRLHFAEIYFSGAGRRVFNVESGGARLIEDLDVFAEAGGAFKALVKELSVRADAKGRVEVRFAKGGADNPKLSALELIDGEGELVRAINAGGPSIGPYAADEGFVGGNGFGS